MSGIPGRVYVTTNVHFAPDTVHARTSASQNWATIQFENESRESDVSVFIDSLAQISAIEAALQEIRTHLSRAERHAA